MNVQDQMWRRCKPLMSAMSASLLAGLTGPAAMAQCGSWDPALGVRVGAAGPPTAMMPWDPDGPGPLLPELVMSLRGSGVQGMTARYLGRYDGERWAEFDALGVHLDVLAMCTWDPDGAGPLERQLVIGGRFEWAGSATASRIARWDGSQWVALGSGLSDTFSHEIRALTAWDPDGSGPLPERLIAGGNFTSIGGVTTNDIAQWDGAAWSPVGSGTTGSGGIFTLTTWDSDGAGPLPAWLIVGGGFTAAGSVAVSQIGAWDGTTWHALRTLNNGYVTTATTWAPDGLPPQLFIGGTFTMSGGTTLNSIGRWDGDEWLPVGGSGLSGLPTNDARILTAVDLDGDGPATSKLLVGGRFTHAGPTPAANIALWNGTSFEAVGSGTSAAVTAASVWDQDGPGSAAPELYVGGEFLTAGNKLVMRLTRWDGSAWHALGNGLESDTRALVKWDPDGAGGAGTSLIAVGNYTISPETTAQMSDVMRWTGDSWLPISPTPPYVRDMYTFVQTACAWDPDGSGPLPDSLIVGGSLNVAGGTRNVIMWNGSAWQPMGDGLGASFESVYRLTTWDPDGPAGPLPRRLIAVGGFKRSGSAFVGGVAMWNGAAWQGFPTGGGVAFSTGEEAYLEAAVEWDPDGAGPIDPQLVVAGSFDGIWGTPAKRIARWDGGTWHAMGAGFDDQRVTTLLAHDFDGDGVDELYAGGRIKYSGGVFINGIARWDGALWQPLAGGVLAGDVSSSGVSDLKAWDPDGAGPAPEVLMVIGYFTYGPGQRSAVKTWDGSAWTDFYSPGFSTAHTAEMFDLDGAGPKPEQLVLASYFAFDGTYPSTRLAVWNSLPPAIEAQPLDASACASDTVVFEVAASGGRPIEYQWRLDGQPIDGIANPTAITRKLVVQNLSSADAGSYDCVVSNSCGDTTTDVAELALGACCPADFTGDGLVDFGDYLEFLNLYDAQDVRADLNQDGQVDFADYLEFLNHFDAGC